MNLAVQLGIANSRQQGSIGRAGKKPRSQVVARHQRRRIQSLPRLREQSAAESHLGRLSVVGRRRGFGKRQQFLDARRHQPLLQRRPSHRLGAREASMLGHEPRGPLGHLVRQFPSPARLLGLPRVDPAVQQRRQRQAERGPPKPVEQGQRPFEPVAAGLIFRDDLGQDGVGQPCVQEQSDRRRAARTKLSMRRISAAIRSALTTVTSAAISRIVWCVRSSSAKPKAAANRTARSKRSLSSANRLPGSPIARINPAAKSSCPPTKSMTASSTGS